MGFCKERDEIITLDVTVLRAEVSMRAACSGMTWIPESMEFSVLNTSKPASVTFRVGWLELRLEVREHQPKVNAVQLTRAKI